MTRVLYYIFLIPVSILPFPMLYGLSTVLFYLMYYGAGYRKKVIVQNINNSFPEKTAEERRAITAKFYRHFCDLTLESLKIFTISQEEVRKRMVFNNPEVINKYFDQKRSVIIAGGHFNNWELLAVGVAEAMKHQAAALYKPLTNQFFEGKMRQTRSKYGLQMIPTSKAKEFFEKGKKDHILSATIFGFDQSPGNPEKCYWTTFLNQDTGVQYGVEKFAKEFDLPVVYGRINKTKRGHYSFDFVEVTEKPRETAYGEILEKVNRMLEDDIRQYPGYWLWSHKRWKHKRPASVKPAN